MIVTYKISYSHQATIVNPRRIGEIVVEIASKISAIKKLQFVLRGSNLEAHFKNADGKHVGDDIINMIIAELKKLPQIKYNSITLNIYSWYDTRLLIDLSG